MLFNQFINRKQSRFELVLENQTIDILGFTKPAGIVTVNLVRLSFTVKLLPLIMRFLIPSFSNSCSLLFPLILLRFILNIILYNILYLLRYKLLLFCLFNDGHIPWHSWCSLLDYENILYESIR